MARIRLGILSAFGVLVLTHCGPAKTSDSDVGPLDATTYDKSLPLKVGSLSLKWGVRPAYFEDGTCSEATLALAGRSSTKLKSVSFKPMMKTMGHGTRKVKIDISSDGQSAKLSQVFFSMPGQWELVTELSLDSGETESVEFVYENIPTAATGGSPCR